MVPNGSADDNPARVMEVIGSVHNLTELAERPYTLSLIVGQLAEIERMKGQIREMALEEIGRGAG